MKLACFFLFISLIEKHPNFTLKNNSSSYLENSYFPSIHRTRSISNFYENDIRQHREYIIWPRIEISVAYEPYMSVYNRKI